MKTKKLTIKITRIAFVFYWLCLITLWPLAPLVVKPVRAAEVTLDYNDISVDGQVYYYNPGAPTYVRGTTGSLPVGYKLIEMDVMKYRAYIDFNTTDIPDDSTIDSVSLIVNVTSAYGAGDTVDVKQMDNASTSWTNNPAGNQNFYNYIASETTVYFDNSTDFQSTGSKTIALGSVAASDLQNQLGSDWFSLSFYGSDETVNLLIFSSQDNATPANRPQLVVNYTEGGGGGGAPEFTMTGMLLAVMGGIAGYFVLQRQWNMVEERRGSWRR